MNSKPKPRSFVPYIVGGGVIVAAALLVWLIRGFVGSAPPTPKKVVQEIQVVRPPPPPDTPPPPPPPPKDDVSVPDPQDQAPPDPSPSNEPPPGEQLGVDADGAGGGDSFGLVGRKGGRDLFASGGSALAWYGGVVKDRILEELAKSDKKAGGSTFSISVKVWVRADGVVERVKLVGSTGDRDRDKTIEATLLKMGRLAQPPPANLVQPINIRVVSRV